MKNEEGDMGRTILVGLVGGLRRARLSATKGRVAFHECFAGSHFL
jgi:hypothetical protein